MLSSKNISAEIADILSDRIVKYAYKPGERLVESSIASEMGVSQSSVREALRILQQNGLVDIRQRKGTYVTMLSDSEIRIMYEMLGSLYGVLIRQSMKNITPEHHGIISEIVASLVASAEKGDAEKYFDDIFQFASLALGLVESPLLKKAISDLWLNKKRVEFHTLKARCLDLGKNVKYFKLLEKHIIEGNTEKAVETIMKYTENEMKFALKMC